MHILITDANGKKWSSSLTQETGPVALPLTHRVKTDFENGRDDRPYLPMVFVFDDNNVTLTKHWQLYLVAINYGKRLNNTSRMLDDNVAFCNGTGFNGKAQRRNWILMEDMDNPKDAETDKTRTCGDAFLHMVGDKVSVLNGNEPPPLKSGYSYPETAQEALTSINRYVYTPQNHPAYFFAATTTGADHRSHPFPDGALYPWYKGGTTPVSFFFHVSRYEVIYPPKQWTDNTPQLVRIS